MALFHSPVCFEDGKITRRLSQNLEGMKVKTALHFFSWGGRFYRPPFIDVNEFEKNLRFIVWNLVRQASAILLGGSAADGGLEF